MPFFNALLEFSVRASAAMSQSLVACGTLGATCYSILLSHPWDQTRSLIDFSLATVLMPALVLGITLGVLLNIIVPPLILSSILLIVLIGVAIRTLQQGLRQHRREKQVLTAAPTTTAMTIATTATEEVDATTGNAAAVAPKLRRSKTSLKVRRE